MAKTDGDGDNVLRFSIKRTRPGGIYCPPRGIYFPVLYRVVQTVTQAQIDAVGLTKFEPINDYVHYNISEDTEYFGTITREVVRGIAHGDRDSIVIRHHRNHNEASAYLVGAIDASSDKASDSIYQTEAGIFTMIQRPTAPYWPSPMVIYVADHPADNAIGGTTWEVATTPDGVTKRSEYL